SVSLPCAEPAMTVTVLSLIRARYVWRTLSADGRSCAGALACSVALAGAAAKSGRHIPKHTPMTRAKRITGPSMNARLTPNVGRPLEARNGTTPGAAIVVLLAGEFPRRA